MKAKRTNGPFFVIMMKIVDEDGEPWYEPIAVSGCNFRALFTTKKDANIYLSIMKESGRDVTSYFVQKVEIVWNKGGRGGR